MLQLTVNTVEKATDREGGGWGWAGTFAILANTLRGGGVV